MDEAASLMWANECSCLPVLDEDRKLVGVVTDRDICMAAFTLRKTLRDMRIDEFMTRKVVRCSPADSVEQVFELMVKRGVHRIPVVDHDGRLQGILSRDEIAGPRWGASMTSSVQLSDDIAEARASGSAGESRVAAG